MTRKILLLAGTRPEAIKLAPIILELNRLQAEDFEYKVCSTGQHHEMLYQAFSDFNIKVDYDLHVMVKNQSLAQLTGRLFSSIDQILDEYKPTWVIVQGDTTTAFVGGLCAFYKGIKVAHIEAGLRSHDIYKPFPEEVNRRIISIFADKHFVPTLQAKQNLVTEGIDGGKIYITGNTVIDSLLWMTSQIHNSPPPLPSELSSLDNNKISILITGHRRESFGKGFDEICCAIRDLALHNPDVNFVYPVHLNPNVQVPVTQILGGLKNVLLIPPLGYKQFVWLMNTCNLILTDSGGIQEEAPSLGKLVLVMRDITERPEGIEAGVSRLVGANRNRIYEAVSQEVQNIQVGIFSTTKANPYGDGHASEIIVRTLFK